MPNLKLSSLGLCLLLVPFLFACSTSKKVTETQTRLQNIDDYREVEIDSVASLFGNYRKQEEDEVLYRLEYGMLHHYRMNWDESAKHFQQASRAIEKHYTKDVSKNLQSLIVNDLQLPYAGEAYENIYLSAFNCLNYLHKGDIQGGLVEVRKINHKLELLNDRYKGLANSLMHNKEDEEEEEKAGLARKAVEKVDKKLTDIDLLSRDSDNPVEVKQNSALGRFMTTVLYAKNGSQSDARIELENLRTALEDQGNSDFLEYFPDENSPKASSTSGPSASTPSSSPASSSSPDSSSVELPSENELTSETAYNTLLLAFSGAPPRKRDKSYEFEVVINDDPVQLNFAVPYLEKPGTEVDRIHALVAGDTLRVPRVENMQSVAEAMFQKKLPVLYTRAIMRSFLKAGATEGAAEAAENEMGWFAGWLTEQAGEAVSKSLSEADTRAWQTMPGFAHATVAKVPSGEHEVTFEYLPAKDALETPLHVLHEDGRWVVTTAGLELVNEVEEVSEIDSYGDLAEFADEVEVEDHDLFRTYSTQADAVAAGRSLARHRVPSTLTVHTKNGDVKKTMEFDVYKRRTRTISVAGDKDLDVAESIYSY